MNVEGVFDYVAQPLLDPGHSCRSDAQWSKDEEKVEERALRKQAMLRWRLAMPERRKLLLREFLPARGSNVEPADTVCELCTTAIWGELMLRLPMPDHC